MFYNFICIRLLGMPEHFHYPIMGFPMIFTGKSIWYFWRMLNAVQFVHSTHCGKDNASDAHMIYEAESYERQVHLNAIDAAIHHIGSGLGTINSDHMCAILICKMLGRRNKWSHCQQLSTLARPARSSVGGTSISRARERERSLIYEIQNLKIIPKLPVKMPKTKGKDDGAHSQFFVASNQALSLKGVYQAIQPIINYSNKRHARRHTKGSAIKYHAQQLYVSSHVCWHKSFLGKAIYPSHPAESSSPIIILPSTNIIIIIGNGERYWQGMGMLWL